MSLDLICDSMLAAQAWKRGVVILFLFQMRFLIFSKFLII